MRTYNWIWIASIAGCALGHGVDNGKTDEDLVLTPSLNVSNEGKLAFDTVVFAENPTTLLEVGDFHGYEFMGKAGGVVTITMNASACGSPDTLLDLFGPPNDQGDRGIDLIHNDDASGGSCSLDSKIAGFKLPVDGEYLIVATSFQQRGGGHYALKLSCDNAACALPGAPTFQSSRIAQTDIDSGAIDADQLFEIGDFLFENVYRMEDGMGNALVGAPAGNNARPNFRSVHQGAFGAPEAQSCITCHNIGGDDGAGDKNHNIFQIGDGVNPSSGVPRNPPVVLGLGFRQQIGIEMTQQLQAERQAAALQAVAQSAPFTQPLTAKGVSFGTIVANPDGTFDTSGVRGVDADLVVRPLGWKGREATLRRFVEGGFRVHFGMQTSPSIAKNCASPDPNTFGTGADCHDPDGDGVVDEITEGQLSAMAIYMALRQTPVRVRATTAAAQARADDGETLFATAGCTSCHVPKLQLDGTSHAELPDTTGGSGISVNLATQAKDPHPARNSDGSVTVEAWTDYKRHDMGAALADSKPFKNIPPSHFITTPLWGVATSAPYLHDGRAATLDDAIRGHAGEGQAARDAYVALATDDQAKIQEFLGTLGRAEDVAPPPPPTVDLGSFTIGQTSSTLSFRLPAHTLVPHGGYVIVARSATRQQFEAFYGTTLGTSVVYITTGGAFPQINGSETFSLKNAQGTVIDGPTIGEPSAGLVDAQRTSGSAPAGQTSSWVVRAASPTNATPGAGQSSTGNDRVYISEFADAAGTGNFAFEFVEIFVE